MNNEISYVVTAFAPEDIQKTFITAKKHFHSLIEQPLTRECSVITMNTAHLTLKRRFYLKEGVTDHELLAVLTPLSFAPVTIRAHELSIFKTLRHGNVLVALVENSEPLQSLHNTIAESLSPLISSSYEFEREACTPHLSLLYTLPDETIDQAITYAKKHILPLSFTLDSFSLLKNIPEIKMEREFVQTFHATL